MAFGTPVAYTGADDTDGPCGCTFTERHMLYGFIGRVSAANQLKEGLDVGTQRTRAIADRVSKATLANQDGFVLPEVGADPGSLEDGPVDLEAEMVSLADEQIRFEATARLLEKAYRKIRSSMRDR